MPELRQACNDDRDNSGKSGLRTSECIRLKALKQVLAFSNASIEVRVSVACHSDRHILAAIIVTTEGIMTARSFVHAVDPTGCSSGLFVSAAGRDHVAITGADWADRFEAGNHRRHMRRRCAMGLLAASAFL